MSRNTLEEIIEMIGPMAVKALAIAASFVVFAPLLVALVAPMLH
jgi:hypothetical protein